MRLLARGFWIPATLCLGVAPSLAFLVWVEAMARSPGFAQLIPFLLGLPCVELGARPLAVQAAFDAGLMLSFGLLHTLLAQVPAHRCLARAVGAAQVRALYLIVTGVALALVMANWQVLGPVVWVVVPGSRTADRAGQALFFVLLTLAGRAMTGARFLDFLGLTGVWRGVAEDERTAGNPCLVLTGAYAHVRHPGYALMLAAFLASNVMTLDRLVIFAASLAYLAVGIPVEERKLVALFGAPYEEYRRRVPALIPTFRRS